MFYLIFFEHDKSTAIVDDEDVIHPPMVYCPKTKKKVRSVQNQDNITVDLENEQLSGIIIQISGKLN